MASIKALRKLVAKGKHGKRATAALGKNFDASALGRLERKVDGVGQSVRSSKGFMGKVGRGILSTLTGGRFGRWVGKVTMNGGAKLLRKVGLGRAADWIKVIAARNGLLSKIIKASIGMAMLNKMRQLFSKKKSGDPDEQGNVKPTPKDPFENKLEKDILKKDNLERFNEIKSENQSKELAAQASILKVEADKAKKTQEAALSKKIDPADPAQVQAKSDEIAKANAQMLDVQNKKLDAVNQKLDAQADSIKATREQTAKLHQILSERLKAVYSSLKERLSDKVDEKKQTFFGWLKDTVGRIFRTVMGLGAMLVTILTGMAAPKLKEGWNWVKDKVTGLFGGNKDKSGEDAPKSDSVEVNLGSAANDEPGDADVETDAVEPDDEGIGAGTIATLAGAPLLMGIPAGRSTDTESDVVVDTPGGKTKTKAKVKPKAKPKVKPKAKPGFFSKLGSKIKSIGKSAKSGLAKLGSKVTKFAKGAWTAVKTTAKKAWGGIIKKALGTKLGQKLAKLSLKSIGKIAGKSAGKSLLKKLPIIGLLAGIGFAASRALKKDWIGAAGEIVSGIASCIPGIGTAASAVIDAGLIAKDVMSDNDDGTKVEVDDEGKLKSVDVIDDKDDNAPKTTSNALPKSVQDEYTKATAPATTSVKVTPATTTTSIASVKHAPDPSRAMTPDPVVVAANNDRTLTKKDLESFQSNMKRSTDQIFMMQELMLSNQFIDNTKAFKINGKDNQLNVG